MPSNSPLVPKPDRTEENTDNLVLRTVFLPIADDQTLRECASSRGVSKNVLIRTAVHDYIDKLNLAPR